MLLYAWIIFVFLEVTAAIRNVQLVVPPLLRAGGTATLLCLFDLEQAPLYSVKWYRGQKEFFRFMPKESPAVKIFHIPGIYVDMFTSNQHQVTLHNLPTFVSGEVSCEITTDAPAISTACVSAMLNIRRLDIDLHVGYSEMAVGQNMIANCATSTPAVMSFYINSLRVPLEYVEQTSKSSASLNVTLKESHFFPRGELRLQCSGAISDQYYISSKILAIRQSRESFSRACKNVDTQIVSIIIMFLLYCCLF